MKKILSAFALVGLLAVTQVNAQEDLFSVQYSVGFATGNLKDFNSSASFRGISLEYRYMMQPEIGYGFETGYNLFYDREDYATYSVGTESLSGIQYRYTHSVPILAAFDYYLIPDNKINPFVGLGIGTLYSYRQLNMGMFTKDVDGWQFALRPQVGVLINTPGSDLIIGVKYFGGFKSNDFEGQQYFTVNVGIVF